MMKYAESYCKSWRRVFAISSPGEGKDSNIPIPDIQFNRNQEGQVKRAGLIGMVKPTK